MSWCFDPRYTVYFSYCETQRTLKLINEWAAFIYSSFCMKPNTDLQLGFTHPRLRQMAISSSSHTCTLTGTKLRTYWWCKLHLYVPVCQRACGLGGGSSGSLFHHNWLPEAFGVNWPDDGVNPGGCGYCSERFCLVTCDDWTILLEAFFFIVS